MHSSNAAMFTQVIESGSIPPKFEMDEFMSHRRRILLIQLPIPQPGMEPAQGNVPLAAAYLKLLARQRGLDETYDIEILPASLANRLSDRGLAAEILDRDPWLVGWTCYLWNVERSLDVSRYLKQARPALRVLVGGPEITADNGWVLERPEVDFAAIGEGEQTFCELLSSLQKADLPDRQIAGLYVSPALMRTIRGDWSEEKMSRGDLPLFRQPLPNLNEVSSPYLEGILDAADERLMLLETLRGCIFKCKFCYYPKSYDDLYFVSREKIIANLEHAKLRGAREVVLLDPTLNQRRDFDGFLKLLADCNPDHQFTYFGELRAEGINNTTAKLLRTANFTQVEIGLQSIDPLAQELMDRKNHLKAFERGVRALRDEGISVKVDLIIGLPGDTCDSIRRSLHYLKDSNLYDEVQVFNLSVLPGTAFRHEARELGLEFQPVPPYYVLKTPTLDLADLYQLMDEAEELFDTEFDPLPEPKFPNLEVSTGPRPKFDAWHVDLDAWHVDLDTECVGGNSANSKVPFPPPDERTQAFTLWLRAEDFGIHQALAQKFIEQILDENPHTTLQVILDPGDVTSITSSLLADLKSVCYSRTTYLDRFYSILPGAMKGSKSLLILLEPRDESLLGSETIADFEEFATIVRKVKTLPLPLVTNHH
jgi:radical SAM superfamily enzyme YgiQ (UPF0313 family)